MATIFKFNGFWLIEIRIDKKTKRIRVGKNKNQAHEVFRHVEKLENSQKYGLEVPGETISWSQNISSKLRKRLVDLGFFADSRANTIGDLVLRYSLLIASLKHTTRRNYGNTFRNLRSFFGESFSVQRVTSVKAREFREYLASIGGKNGKPLSEATIARRVIHCRSIFDLAVRMDWIPENPFAEVKTGKQSNKERSFFVSQEIAERVVDHLPTNEDKLIFILARWCGMRIPSEPLELRWDGVDWKRRSLTFRSVKTEHIEGKEFRSCPIFPEVLPFLEEAFETAKPGELYVCPRFRAWKNPRQSFEKIVRRAMTAGNVKPWPRIFGNLRATRATEIDSQFGSKAESDWIGHGADVALKHYLMIPDSVWKRATGASEENEDQESSFNK